MIIIPLELGAKTPFIKVVYSRAEYGYVVTIVSVGMPLLVHAEQNSGHGWVIGSGNFVWM